jgi:hypothetical protein
MDDELIALLDEVHSYGVAHDASKADRLERLRNVEPDTAQLLAVLIRAIRPRSVLELGTSNGYSTLWLADAVRAIDGRLVSTDIDPDRSAQAARNLDRAGLRELVELRVQDAAVTLREASDAGARRREHRSLGAVISQLARRGLTPARVEADDGLPAHPGHCFLTDDISMSDGDVPSIAGYRQVTDAHLLTLFRRRGARLVTFDASILAMGDENDVEVLTTR